MDNRQACGRAFAEPAVPGQAADVDLPQRPRVLPGLPLLRRRADVVQIGTDPRHAVLVEDVPEPMASVLLGLDGRATLDDLCERLAGHGRQAAEFAGV
ncbi:MAG: hypothetical protein HOV94_36885, partial [Saccharothrix sp.]|nr:hypothetical protein [Saccharothrix sp.]